MSSQDWKLNDSSHGTGTAGQVVARRTTQTCPTRSHATAELGAYDEFSVKMVNLRMGEWNVPSLKLTVHP